MRGACPECGRTFEISDEFLAMGGKAKCPHCMLDLEFGTDGRSRRHRHRAPTRVDPDHRPTPAAQPPEEVDARCDNCAKNYKIDSEYLRLGGSSLCPYCGVDLWIDPSVDPRKGTRIEDQVSTDRGAPEEEGAPEPEQVQQQDQDQDGSAPLDYSDTERFGLSDLGIDAGAEPSNEDEVPTTYLKDGRKALDDALRFDGPEQDGALPTDVMQSPFVSPEAEAQPRRAEGDFAPGRIAEEVAEETQAEEPSAPGQAPLAGSDATLADGGTPAEITGETVEADSLGPVDATLPDPAGAISTPQAESQAHDREETVEAAGLFTGLASADDWASAAERWARSGFKAEEMPAFIKAEGKGGAAQTSPSPGGEPQAVLPSLTEASPGVERTTPQVKRPGAAATGLGPDTVEVSDADILTLDDSEIVASPASLIAGPSPREVQATPAPGSWAARAAVDLAKQKAAAVQAKPRAPTRALVLPAFLGRLANPALLAGVLGLLVLVIIAVLYLWLGRTEDVESRAFPEKDLKNPLLAAAEPSAYNARDEALRHYGLGNRLAYQGDLEGAIAEYQASQRLDPGFPHPHRAMGAMFAALGKTDLALQSYEAYLRLAPHSADSGDVRKIVDQAKPK